MQEKQLALIGFMGSGKSFTSKELGNILSKTVFSTDIWIEKSQNKTIAQIFQTEGELFFRQCETHALKEALRKKDVIIDCGGGIVTNPGNLAQLKSHCFTIYLKTSPEWVLKRVKNLAKRPLLNVPNPQEKINELLNARRLFYEQADLTVNTDGKTPRQVAEEIVKLIK